uniref:Uncharacterized protein n=1 Tax=Sinocyclocheilus grahami TaxID=75366 RepID=A0A672QDJ6_SINGR
MYFVSLTHSVFEAIIFVDVSSAGAQFDAVTQTDSPPLGLKPEPPQLSEREKDLQELKKFDLDWKFGPCTGGSLIVGERAALHGLNPPQRIKDIFLKESLQA